LTLKLIPIVPEEALLTTAETAKKLGCSQRHVLDLIHRGELGFCDFTAPNAKKRHIKIPESEAANYIARRRIAPRISA
jgi:excisionase family DNA binding protein